jgi:hypothetical protein
VLRRFVDLRSVTPPSHRPGARRVGVLANDEMLVALRVRADKPA